MDKHQEYKKFRSRLLELMDDATPTLDKIQERTGREYELPIRKIREDECNIVLVGIFQSGKSTLFNYLCDGREISQLGTGVATSGCRVSAHYTDGEEYARIAWRSRDDLLMSLGKDIAAFYNSENHLTSKDVNLDDPAARAELMEHAWEALEQKNLDGTQHTTAQREMLRFALIVAHFYESFKERCLAGEEKEADIGKVVQYTSYPSRWRARWGDVIKQNRNLDLFSAEEVAFVFCGGVDVYLRSENLRSLQASVVDCPGFQASTWDSKVAEKCIRNADIVLFTFEGEKSIEESHLKLLKAAKRWAEEDGKARLLYGANLHGSKNKWEREGGVMEDVLSILKDNELGRPQIHQYHAGIALRTLEYEQESNHKLSPESLEGIHAAMNRDEPKWQDCQKNHENRLAWLKNTLLTYIRTFTGDGNQTFEHYEQDYTKLEELSMALDLIGTGNRMVADNKGNNILVKNGVNKVLKCLNDIPGDIAAKKKDLSAQAEERKADKEQADKNLEDYRRAYDSAVRNLSDHVNELEDETKETVRALVKKHLKDDAAYREQLAKETYNLTATWTDAMFGSTQEKNARANAFDRFLQGKLMELTQRIILPACCEQLSGKYQELRQKFDGKSEELRNLAKEKLENIALPEAVKLNQQEILNALRKSDYWDNAKSFFRDMEQDRVSAIYDLLSLGWRRLVISETERARDIVDKSLDGSIGFLKKIIEDTLMAEKVGNSPAGFLRNIRSVYDEFCMEFKKPIQTYEDRAKQSEKDWNKSKDEKERISAELDTLNETLIKMTEEFETLKNEIVRVFPE